jgi:D-3-phosphoglycerate dehydrogenase
MDAGVTGAQDTRLEALVLDLLEWVAPAPRPYAEVMDAWRTSCPRLAVWEEAVARGLIVAQAVEGRGVRVAVTPAGVRLLEMRRPKHG